jgi:HrpA-like RNA helicase
MDETSGENRIITRMGISIAKLPLGVRYGKMLLVAAQAGVLDYAIEWLPVYRKIHHSPMVHNSTKLMTMTTTKTRRTQARTMKSTCLIRNIGKEIRNKWRHRGGDVLAGMLAVGAYSYASEEQVARQEKAACQRFCNEMGLSYSVMVRIQKMRLHLAGLAKARLASAGGVAARTGGIISSMRPPNKLEENLLCQAICSGLLDNVAMIAPPGYLSGNHPFGFRSAYIVVP